MKSSSIILVFLVSLASACVYHTENVYEEYPDASEDSMPSQVNERGSAKSLVLTRGQFQPKSCGNAIWEPAGVYTVQFSSIPQGTSALPQNDAPTITLAIVKWTVDGNDIQRIVTVANGVSLAGVGAGATIQVYDATDLAGSISPDPFPQYMVTVTISPGTRGSSVNPPVYFPAIKDPNTGVPSSGQLTPISFLANIPVPPNAGVISVQVTAGPVIFGVTPFLMVYQLAPDGTILKQYNALAYPEWVPLDPAANRILLQNMDPANTCSYGIGFGVDG